jgi:hypothetical protein
MKKIVGRGKKAESEKRRGETASEIAREWTREGERKK